MTVPTFADAGSSTMLAASRLLEKAGLGRLDPSTVVSRAGRNETWLAETTGGEGVFVKRLVGERPETARRLRRLVSAEALAAWCPDFPAVPPCHGWDDEARLLAYGRLGDAEDAATLADRDAFPDDLARTTGRMIGRLHGIADPAALADVDTSGARFPPADELVALSWRTFRTASAGELEVWRILQGDRLLAERLADLCRPARPVGPVPVHGDLRLDQILVAAERVYLVDWEEFRMGDPARDIGSFVGEWLYRAVAAVDSGRTDDLAHEDVLATTVAEFTRFRPLITAFWAGYRQARPTEDPGLAERAAAFAGWHQFDRLFAAAHRRARLAPVERAVAGIGRSLLAGADRFAGALGLEV